MILLYVLTRLIYGYDMGLRFVEIIEKREHAFKTRKFKTGVIDRSSPKHLNKKSGFDYILPE